MSEPQDEQKQKAKKSSDEYGAALAFLPIGVTFFVLGLSNPTFLAIGMPFLVLGLVMLANAKGKQDEADESDKSHVANTNRGTSRD